MFLFSFFLCLSAALIWWWRGWHWEGKCFMCVDANSTEVVGMKKEMKKRSSLRRGKGAQIELLWCSVTCSADIVWEETVWIKMNEECKTYGSLTHLSIQVRSSVAPVQCSYVVVADNWQWTRNKKKGGKCSVCRVCVLCCVLYTGKDKQLCSMRQKLYNRISTP